MVLPETRSVFPSHPDRRTDAKRRMRLDFGGDDITELLYTLLQRIIFPYRELDISKWCDWHLIENLKERMIVLSEVRRFGYISVVDKG